MAPRRLIRKSNLREMAGRLQGTDLDSWRFRIIAHTPTVFLDYLLEVLLGSLAIVGAAFQFSGLSKSVVKEYLPDWVLLVYGISLLVGGLTVVGGLRFRKYGTAVPIGMRLLASACLAYAVAVLFSAGLEVGATAIGNAFILSVLAGWRAFTLRTTYVLVDILGPERIIPTDETS